jgi:hypothetical protein
MNKWLVVVVLDLMVLTAAMGLKVISTHTSQANTRMAASITLPAPF